MPGKCSLNGCRTGYDSKKDEEVVIGRKASFQFPMEHSVLCEDHFEGHFIRRHAVPTTLDWKKDPVPSIRQKNARKREASASNPESIRNRQSPKAKENNSSYTI